MVAKTGGCAGEGVGEVARKGTVEIWGAGNGECGDAL